MAVVAVPREPTWASPGSALEGPRRRWMDNLRVAVIAGVIVAHVATAYVVDYDWYYEEKPANAVTEVVLTVVFGPGVLFAMGVLFLVAGMLSHRSLARKGPWPFARDRLLRLGLPVAVFTFIIGPVTGLIGQRAEGDPEADDASQFLVDAIGRASTGTMWFVAALLVFSTSYAAWRWLRPATAGPHHALGWRQLGVAAATIVVGSFVVRLVWPAGDHSPFGVMLWEWPQMATVFALGVLGGERGWLDPMPERLRRGCGRVSIAAAVAAVAFFAVVVTSGDADPFLGGWHAQALAGPLIEATLAVTMSLWLVGWFPRHWNQHSSLAGTLG